MRTSPNDLFVGHVVIFSAQVVVTSKYILRKLTCFSCFFLSFAFKLSSSTMLLRRSFKERCDVIRDCSLYSCGVTRSQKDTTGPSSGTITG